MAMPLSSAALRFSSPRPSLSPFRSISATSSSFLPSALPYSNHNSGSLSISSSRATLKVLCGRGDRRTKKGKRFAHTYGNARPRNKSKGKGPLSAATPINPYKKIYESEFTEDDYKGLEFVEPPSRRAKEDDGDDDE